MSYPCHWQPPLNDRRHTAGLNAYDRARPRVIVCPCLLAMLSMESLIVSLRRWNEPNTSGWKTPATRCPKDRRGAGERGTHSLGRCTPKLHSGEWYSGRDDCRDRNTV